MKQVVLIMGGNFQRNASAFLREMEQLNTFPDSILCLQAHSGMNSFFRRIASGALQVFKPGFYKTLLTKFICGIRGYQTLVQLRNRWTDRGENSWEIMKPGFDILRWANEKKIPVHFHSSMEIPVLKHLTMNKPTLFIYYGGGILTKAHTGLENAEFLNAHMGELPQYRGMNVLEWAVLEEQPTKVSVMVMNEKIDGGDIIYKLDIPTGGIKTIPDLRRVGFEFCAKAMAISVKDYRDGKISRVPQPDKPENYYRMHDKIRKMLLEKLFRK